MIELHVDSGCSECLRLRERLERTGWSCRIVFHDARPGHTEEFAHAMIDDDEVVRGHREITRHMDEMADFVRQWYSHQSDACGDCLDEERS